ncbi:DUF1707 domain-containing protein [Nocardioides sp. STR2]|uniref:DUF1707 domain-containing protein n=1 Tax=Nocardioides pini TaxID=2975053 RepID=A0ABT4CEA9_9ACTN|nr:DUF1707 domain-containing protein [Nocardioides pini]MCY4727313.1 DUF1707 domain-containing protein [Nocardioides pini]
MSAGTWERFEHDPRSPQAARLRASDRDRELALEVLGQAYADGRLDHDEYDARSTAATTAKVLADLVPQLEDLVPDASDAALQRRGAGIVARPDLHEQAVRLWAKDRREALTGLVGISVITCTIWAVTMWGGFPWPLFPILAAAVNLLRIQMQEQDIVEGHERHLLKRERKEIERRRKDAGD